MDCYLLMLYVTLEQEEAIQELFLQRRWEYRKKEDKQIALLEELLKRLETDVMSEKNLGINSGKTGNRYCYNTFSSSSNLGFSAINLGYPFGHSDPMIEKSKLDAGLENVYDGDKGSIEGHVTNNEASLAQVGEDEYAIPADEEDGENENNTDMQYEEGGYNITNNESDNTSVDHDDDKPCEKEQLEEKGDSSVQTLGDMQLTIKSENESDVDLDVKERNVKTKGLRVCLRTEERSTLCRAGLQKEEGNGKDNKGTKLASGDAQQAGMISVKPPLKRNFYCEECDRYFARESSLKSHKRDGKCKFECEYCGKIFISFYYNIYMQHLACHRSEELSKSASGTPEDEVLMQLARSKSVRIPLNKKFYCEECDRYFAKESSLKSHKKNGKCRFECEYCGRIFISLFYSNYLKHLACHRDERSAECTICGKRFRDERTLKSHMWMHNNEYPHVCSICGKGFRQKTVLIEHIKVKHEGVKRMPVQCEKCGGYFSSKTVLITHMKTVHLPKDSVPFECSQCGKTFKSPMYLRKHMVTHKNDRNFQCEICSKLFTTSSHLAAHKIRHTKSYRFICKECSKGFHSNDELTAHLRTHSGEKPFKCDYCNYRCAIKSNLRFHLRTHGIRKSVVNTASQQTG